MKGILKNYVEQKSYGFIKGEDGKDYFFHSSFLNKAFKNKTIKSGLYLEFDPTPTPKGLAAKKANILETFKTRNITPFKNFKSKNINQDNTYSIAGIETRFFKDRDDAFNHLEKMAKNSKANVLFNTKFESKVFSDGNYKYKKFKAIGSLGVHVEEKESLIKTNPEIDDSNFQKAIDLFLMNLKIVQDEENEAIKKDERNLTGFCLFLFIIFMFFVFLGQS